MVVGFVMRYNGINVKMPDCMQPSLCSHVFAQPFVLQQFTAGRCKGLSIVRRTKISALAVT